MFQKQNHFGESWPQKLLKKIYLYIDNNKIIFQQGELELFPELSSLFKCLGHICLLSLFQAEVEE